MFRSTFIRLALVTALVVPASVAHAAPVGSAFTYQGRIDRGGSPVTDTYAMIFRLFDAASGGAQVGADQALAGVVATSGLFTVTLDFGASAFTGQARWLDIQVKGSADANYTALTPRQAMTATPYALYALNSAGGGTSQWVNDAGGIEYTAGHVGVGTPATSSAFLRIAGAAGPGNPIWVTNSTANYATLYCQNTASGGYGFFDDISAYHYFKGALGIGTSTVTAGTKIELAGTGAGLRASIKGSAFVPISAAIIANGLNSPAGDAATGLYATGESGMAIIAVSTGNDGVYGQSSAAGRSGITGISTSAGGQAGYFRNDGGGAALMADGIAKVKTLQILGGADLAERFETGDAAEPGTVMSIDPSLPGHVRIARGAYSRTVAGVVSGANGLAAGIELARDDKRESTVALALTGRVWVRCDATHAAIHAGDLLTTANRDGHAMRADNHNRSQGAIIGKAMTSLETGTGLVLVLVSLQ